MADWLIISIALILAFVAAAFLGERLCRRLAQHARQRRSNIAFNPLDESNDEEDRVRD